MQPSSSSAAPTPEWARVRILLNIGHVVQATEAARHASRSIEWSRIATSEEPWCFAGPDIYPSDEIPIGWAWFEPGTEEEHARVLISSWALDEYGHAVVLMDFVNRTGRLLRQASFRRYEVRQWDLLRPKPPGEFDDLPEDPHEGKGWYQL